MVGKSTQLELFDYLILREQQYDYAEKLPNVLFLTIPTTKGK